MNAARGVDLVPSNGAVDVRGDLTLATASEAVRESHGVIGQGPDRLVFDLAGLGQCDSAALAVLLEWQREAARQKRSLAWRNVPERLRQLARISELESVLGFD